MVHPEEGVGLSSTMRPVDLSVHGAVEKNVLNAREYAADTDTEDEHCLSTLTPLRDVTDADGVPGHDDCRAGSHQPVHSPDPVV